MQINPYFLATDGSNGKGLKKMDLLLGCYFDEKSGYVTANLLDICVSKSGTAECLFKSISDVLKECGISWDNWVRLSVGNTSVNLGQLRSTIFNQT